MHTTTIIGAETPEQAVARLTAEIEQLQAEITRAQHEQVESWNDPRVKTLGETLYEEATTRHVRREYEVMARALGFPLPLHNLTGTVRITVEVDATVEAMSSDDARVKVMEDVREQTAPNWARSHLQLDALPPGVRIVAISPTNNFRTIDET